MQTSDNLRRQRRIAIALVGLIALVMVGLGVWSIIEAHHVGVTKRSVVVTLDGTAARWMGAVQICIGMLLLMVAMPNKRIALRWGLVWVALGAASFFLALRAI